MSIRGSRLHWLTALSTVLSLAACYGTLAVIALLGVLGTAIAINETLWAGAIVAFAAIATVGLGLGLTRHLRWSHFVGQFGSEVKVYSGA